MMDEEISSQSGDSSEPHMRSTEAGSVKGLTPSESSGGAELTLPIPSSGLLTSPTQMVCHQGPNASPSARFGTPVSPTAESHFSLAPLLSRGANTSAAARRSRAAILTTSTDGSVRVTESPLPWPTPLHLQPEFGHTPSRAGSSGGEDKGVETPTRRRSSCDNLTLAKMAPMAGSLAVEATSKPPPMTPCLEFPDLSVPPSNQDPASPTALSPRVTSPLQQTPPQSPEAVLESALAADAEAAVQSANSECDAAADAADAARPSSASAVEGLSGHVDEAEHDQPEMGPVESEIAASAAGEAKGGDADCIASATAEEDEEDDGDVMCSSYGEPSGEVEAPLHPWIAAEDTAVTDAIAQLQAVVSGLSEPYQRYIRERALELTRIIDENLQRQGFEPGAAGYVVAGGGEGGGPGNAMKTPSSKAATAAAALVLAVAASGTRWPYSTPVGDSSAGGAGEEANWEGAASAVGKGKDVADGGGGRWLFRSPALGEAGLASAAGTTPHGRPRADLIGMGLVGLEQPQRLGAMEEQQEAHSGSCTLCFGSVLGNSQAPQMDSADHLTSGAVSARAAAGAASQHGPSSARPTPRSRSYSSFYAQNQSMRRNAAAHTRAIPGEPPSAISSACSNAYGTSSCQQHQQQPSDGAARVASGAGGGACRRAPPRPPPRGLGCGLGQPRQVAPACSANSQLGSELDGLYTGRPSLEPSISSDIGRDQQLPGELTRRSRVSGQAADPHVDVVPTQQLGDAAEGQGPGTGLRKAAGRAAGPGGGGARTGVAAGAGSYAKLASNARAAAAARGMGSGGAGLQQPGWQSGRGAAAAALDKQQRAEKLTARGGLSARETAAPAQQPLQRNGRRGAGALLQEPSPAADGGDADGCDSARPSARSHADDIRTSYQQLLRKSSISRSSQASLNRKSGAAAHAAQRPAGHNCSSFPITTTSTTEMAIPEEEPFTDAMSTPACPPAGHKCEEDEDVALPTAWEQLAPPELPYQLVQVFPAAAAAVTRHGQGPNWQPLHTALKLDELLASYPAAQSARDSSAGPTAPETAQGPLRARQSGTAAAGDGGRAVVGGGGGRPGALGFPAGGADALGGSVLDALAAVDGDGMEPATAFVIVSRRATREVPDDGGLGHGGGGLGGTLSSTLDLSSLLPAPAWRQGRAVTEPVNRAGGGTAATTDAGNGTCGAAEDLAASASSACSSNPWNQDAPTRPAGRAPASGAGMNAGAERGGGAARSAAGGDTGLNQVGGSGQGRRWPLENDRMVVPDRDQIRAGSPARPRYARHSDSHTSPTATRKDTLPSRKRDTSAPRDDTAATRTIRNNRPGVPPSGPPTRAKPAAAKRPNGTLGATNTTNRTPVPGPARSRSTPHARAAKTIRAARAHVASRPPIAPAAVVQPVLQPQRPGTPVAPSSPPPPLQSQTPVHLQQQQQVQQQQSSLAGPGARRWADDAPDRAAPAAPAAGGTGNSPTTPTRRRLHAHSPEDMPLSAAARQSSQPRAGIADTTAGVTTAGTAAATLTTAEIPPSVGVGLGSGLGLLAGLPPVAAPPPAAVAGGWGALGGSFGLGLPPHPSHSMPPHPPQFLSQPQYQGQYHLSSGAFSKPGTVKQASPRLHGVSYAALPSSRWAAPRPYGTASAHHDGATNSAPHSPGQERAAATAWHHDCTPNILSPPRNYDRSWVSPPRGRGYPQSQSQPQSATKCAEGAAAAAAVAALGTAAAGGGAGGVSFPGSLRPQDQVTNREAGDVEDGVLVPGHSPTVARVNSVVAAVVRGGHEHALEQAQRSLHPTTFGGHLATGFQQPPALPSAGVGASQPFAAAGLATTFTAPTSRAAQATAPSEPLPATAPPPPTSVAHLNITVSSAACGTFAGHGAQGLTTMESRVGSGSVHGHSAGILGSRDVGHEVPKDGSLVGSVATSAGSDTVRGAAHPGLLLPQHHSSHQQHHSSVRPQLPLPPHVAATSAGGVGGDGPPLGLPPRVAVADEALRSGGSIRGDPVSSPDHKAAGLRPDLTDLPSRATTVGGHSSARRTSSEGSKSTLADSIRSHATNVTNNSTLTNHTSTTAGGSRPGGSGRPPTGASFRPSSSLRAVPAGSGGAQQALLQQAAWPGLRDPRVMDAIAHLEAGIAVLDPTPPPPPSSLGSSDAPDAGPVGGGSSGPNGCFGLFNRNLSATPRTATHTPRTNAPPAPPPEPVGQRPVLLKVQVADGAVELVVLRPRRAGSAAAPPPPPAAASGAAAAPLPSAGEQRVRVAALSGLNPPLSALTAAGGAAAVAQDDLADPASRWLQLVAMDGGVMKLSACSPADHARLVLGLNAGLMAAMGAIGEDAPLSVVPLCRGLGGAP